MNKKHYLLLAAMVVVFVLCKYKDYSKVAFTEPSPAPWETQAICQVNKM